MVNPQRERFEWVPAIHSFLGGIKIDEKSQTSLVGLFASGEAACGMHGISPPQARHGNLRLSKNIFTCRLKSFLVSFP